MPATHVSMSSHEARTRWSEVLDKAIGGADVVVKRWGKPVVAVIRYADFAAIQEQLDDLRAARRAALAYEEWKRDPSLARPWEEVEAELIAEGRLDG